jgi:hypothetical protein
MKISYKVINLGLNELGVKEINDFYKENINNKWISEFKLGDIFIKRSKRFHQEKYFLNKKEDSYFGTIDIKSNKGWFEIKLKHINYKITKIEITENKSDFNFN